MLVKLGLLRTIIEGRFNGSIPPSEAYDIIDAYVSYDPVVTDSSEGRSIVTPEVVASIRKNRLFDHPPVGTWIHRGLVVDKARASRWTGSEEPSGHVDGLSLPFNTEGLVGSWTLDSHLAAEFAVSTGNASVDQSDLKAGKMTSIVVSSRVTASEADDLFDLNSGSKKLNAPVAPEEKEVLSVGRVTVHAATWCPAPHDYKSAVATSSFLRGLLK